MEWIVAVLVSPASAMAFLGTQGDVFDSQKDSGLAALGAIITAIAVTAIRKKRGAAGGTG